MERQLALLDTETDWRLDEDTCAIGRRGLESARASLRDALRRAAEADPRGRAA
jgi:hypothetical protein